MHQKIPYEFRITSTYLEILLLYLCFIVFKTQVELKSYLNHNWQEQQSTDTTFHLYMKHWYIRHNPTHPTQVTPLLRVFRKNDKEQLSLHP